MQTTVWFPRSIWTMCVSFVSAKDILYYQTNKNGMLFGDQPSANKGRFMDLSWTSFFFFITQRVWIYQMHLKKLSKMSAIFHKNAEFPVFHGTEKWIQICKLVHQMDLYPAVSMLHVRFHTVGLGLDRLPVLCQPTHLTSNMCCIWLSQTGLSNKPQAQSLIYAKGAFQHAGLSCQADTVKYAVDMTNF